MVSYAPETQKALNNQGFEYGGSVEIRTLIPGTLPPTRLYTLEIKQSQTHKSQEFWGFWRSSCTRTKFASECALWKAL